MRQSWETMTSISAGDIILTHIQPLESGRPQQESNPESTHQEPHALPTELLHPLVYAIKYRHFYTLKIHNLGRWLFNFAQLYILHD